MPRFLNMARMATPTVGTGSTIALGPGVEGFNTFADAGAIDGDVLYLAIEEETNNEPTTREVGYYTYRSNGGSSELITRTVLDSTSGGSPIDLKGLAQVFSTPVRQGLREILTADATFYVRTDGNDSNNGLTNTAGGAFRTIQNAVNVAYALDLNNHNVTIQVAEGTYSEDVSFFTPFVGNGFVTIIGDTVTPSNVTVSSAAWCFLASGYLAGGLLRGLKFVCPAGSALFALGGGFFDYMSCEFGDCTGGYHGVAVGTGASVGWSSNGTNIISGGAIAHLAAFGTGAVVGGSALSTINLVGTPNFSDAFVVCEGAGVDVENITFTGTGATGVRFHAEYNGQITPTFGSGINYLPGSLPGYVDDTSGYNQFRAFSSLGLGTVSSGTITALDFSNTFKPAARQWYYTNGGAHTFPAPTMDGYLRVLVTNNASAGVITFTGFTTKASPGDALTTTNGQKFLIEIFTINAISTYRVYALQ